MLKNMVEKLYPLLSYCLYGIFLLYFMIGIISHLYSSLFMLSKRKQSVDIVFLSIWRNDHTRLAVINHIVNGRKCVISYWHTSILHSFQNCHWIPLVMRRQHIDGSSLIKRNRIFNFTNKCATTQFKTLCIS